ncbi:MAG: helix-turn-helix transcriptional regulator [Candidatus Xenobia bacterium]
MEQSICRLREILAQRRLPVMWLASQTSISPSSFYNWMKGKHVPTHRDALATANALGLTVEDIWPTPVAQATGPSHSVSA